MGYLHNVIALQLADPTRQQLVAMPWSGWQPLAEQQNDVSSGARSSQWNVEVTSSRNVHRNRHEAANPLLCAVQRNELVAVYNNSQMQLLCWISVTFICATCRDDVSAINLPGQSFKLLRNFKLRSANAFLSHLS